MRFRIGLRTLLVVIGILAAGCGWYAANVRACAAEQAALNRIKSGLRGTYLLVDRRGTIDLSEYWYDVIVRTDPAPGMQIPDRMSKWLRRTRSSDDGELALFRRVHFIELGSQADPKLIEHLESFRCLKSIHLSLNFFDGVDKPAEARERIAAVEEAARQFVTRHPEVELILPGEFEEIIPLVTPEDQAALAAEDIHELYPDPFTTEDPFDPNALSGSDDSFQTIWVEDPFAP
ncbi:hypothetical protein AB1L30_21735 [Bremerella sp. JC817]|uniref:hypothetical protein n=1 Tax=Bremerella sp. JC817 TaxID=3231756 RepID=UPI003459D6A6